jgi:hypothetical protein
MPTPRKGYFTANGTRVPSVTTILSRFKESGGLINWAWKLGTEGKDYREIRDAAADAGTMAHSLIDAHIHQTQVTISGDEDTVKKANQAFEAYLNWQRNSQFNIEWTERQLISEKHRYGGTPDAFGTINNQPVLLDWKSSNAIYSDYLLQLAAYAELIRENYGIEVQGFYLCRFAKENGDFSVHHYPELNDALRMFLLLREAYDLDKILKRRAA